MMKRVCAAFGRLFYWFSRHSFLLSDAELYFLLAQDARRRRGLRYFDVMSKEVRGGSMGGELVVKLYTAGGYFVQDLTIPDFQPPPKILIWGERFFVNTLLDTTPEGERVVLYNEAFCYAVPLHQ